MQSGDSDVQVDTVYKMCDGCLEDGRIQGSFPSFLPTDLPRKKNCKT